MGVLVNAYYTIAIQPIRTYVHTVSCALLVIYCELVWQPSMLPSLWVCYVDDTFVIWTRGHEEVRQLHHHLNNQHPM